MRLSDGLTLRSDMTSPPKKKSKPKIMFHMEWVQSRLARKASFVKGEMEHLTCQMAAVQPKNASNAACSKSGQTSHDWFPNIFLVWNVCKPSFHTAAKLQECSPRKL